MKPVRCGESAEESAVIRRSFGILFTVAPWPFFWLGIPCAPLLANILFRTTCVGYAGFMFLGFNAQSLDWQKMMHRIGLFWNIVSSWIVSAWWCSGPISWSILMVTVLTLVAMSGHVFSLGGQRWRSSITAFGACVSYYGRHPGWFGHVESALLRRLSASPGGQPAPRGNATAAGEEEEEEAISEGEVWACATAVLAMLFVVCLDVLLRCRRHRGNQVIAAAGGAGAAPTAPPADAFAGVVPKPIVVAPLGEPQAPGTDGPAVVAALPSAVA